MKNIMIVIAALLPLLANVASPVKATTQKFDAVKYMQVVAAVKANAAKCPTLKKLDENRKLEKCCSVRMPDVTLSKGELRDSWLELVELVAIQKKQIEALTKLAEACNRTTELYMD